MILPILYRLILLRFAHRSGVVLEVKVLGDSQLDSRAPINSSPVDNSLLPVSSPSNKVTSMKIAETDEHQTPGV